MTITNGYCTTDDLRAQLSIEDAVDDPRLEAVITAVSRLIDVETRRRFYTTDADETRYFTASSSEWVLTGDIASVTSVATDDGSGDYATAWASTDFQLSPFNASVDGLPYTEIKVRRLGTQVFNPCVEAGVKVVGKFGVPSNCPWLEIVREACLIQCARLFKRKDSPFGIAGTGEFGQLSMLKPTLDPDVKAMLAPPIRRLQV
jgi:hypothetical protein